MKTSEFFFDLPKELIAAHPVSPRDESRLMVLHRSTGEIEHHIFYELPKLISKDYLMVLNKTKVFPARLKVEIDGKNAEILLLKQIIKNTWQCMVKPGKKFKKGISISVRGQELSINAEVLDIYNDGTRVLKFNTSENILDWSEKNGYPPFPPYIKNTKATLNDYQTLYAKDTGSIASPTAGLHFTDRVFKDLDNHKIKRLYVTLHVGRGTFLPVKSENIEDHQMHSEWYEITDNTAFELNTAKALGKKILTVGTTSTRTLESNYKNYKFLSETNETDIFIYPGYKFKAVDALLTNFHLPESTLIMLVSAFAGKDHVFKAYEEAIRQKYRFYSFGDSMLIL
jgi:S-adenosylmethionine:tRNA ribosyltransferase-isomerase